MPNHFGPIGSQATQGGAQVQTSQNPPHPSNCQWSDFEHYGYVTVYLVMQAQSAPGWITNYNQWLQGQWSHYTNPNAHWGSCNWFNRQLNIWIPQLAGYNPNSYQYALKQAKIAWATMLLDNCCLWALPKK